MKAKSTAAMASIAVMGFASSCAIIPGFPRSGDDPTARELAVTAGFGTRIRMGTSVGIEFNEACQAYFPEAANHLLILLDTFDGLTVEAAGDDVVLLIEFGEASFCGPVNDPVVTRDSWSEGTYRVFVGTPTEGVEVDYTLEFVE